mmetsp:Transcript_29815/g.30246  ORF Transcript_29815/g.30246 Transcript_29815/m.30246 type:complete len:130 (-) Transcript_29815:79-468(-)
MPYNGDDNNREREGEGEGEGEREEREGEKESKERDCDKAEKEIREEEKEEKKRIEGMDGQIEDDKRFVDGVLSDESRKRKLSEVNEQEIDEKTFMGKKLLSFLPKSSDTTKRPHRPYNVHWALLESSTR